MKTNQSYALFEMGQMEAMSSMIKEDSTEYEFDEFTCQMCGDLIPLDMMFNDDGEKLCPECFANLH